MDEANLVRLSGAHGEEIVRSIYVDQEVNRGLLVVSRTMLTIQHGTVYTGGEDGKVRAWRSPDTSQDPRLDIDIKPSTKPKDRTAKDARFKPY